MSYAEQFFGTKQNQVLQYAENLAFFGEESYVYKNASLMKEVIANEIAMLNPTTALYAYLWVRENGLKAIDYFNVGFVIELYHSELNMTFHFVLIKFNDDGSAVFVNREPCIAGVMTSSTDGSDILMYEDYDIVHYLNGEKNWFYKWENKPASVPLAVTNVNNMYIRLREMNGFLSGIDTKVKKLLKTFKEGHDFLILPMSHDDFMEPAFLNLECRKQFHIMNENCVNFFRKYCRPDENPSTVYVGRGFGTAFIEEVTADRITKLPLYRSGVSGSGGHNDLDTIQNSGSSSVPRIDVYSNVNLKIQF